MNSAIETSEARPTTTAARLPWSTPHLRVLPVGMTATNVGNGTDGGGSGTSS